MCVVSDIYHVQRVRAIIKAKKETNTNKCVNTSKFKRRKETMKHRVVLRYIYIYIYICIYMYMYMYIYVYNKMAY